MEKVMKKFLIIGFLLATADVRLQAADQQPPTAQGAIPIPATPSQEGFAAILQILQQQTAALITMQQQMGTQQQQTANLIAQQQTNLLGRKIYPCLFPGCGKSYTRNEYRQRHTAQKHPDFQPAIPAPAPIVQAPAGQEPIAPAAIQAPAIPAPAPIVQAPAAQEPIAPAAVQAPAILVAAPIVQAPAGQKPIAQRPKIDSNFRQLPDGRYQCKHCDHEPYKSDTLPGVLYHHTTHKHRTPNKTYDCTICGKRYKQPYSLTRHKQSDHLQVNAQVNAQVDDQVNDQVDDQVNDQVDDQVNDQVDDQDDD